MVIKSLLRKSALAVALVTVLGLNFSNTVNAQSSNYWTNEETFQIRYDGYIQFVPNYRTDSNSGYGLESGKYVKQAYINYVRNDESVIGGRQYTSVATSGTTAIYTSASCWDSLLIGEKYTTHFYYGWIYR